MGYLCEKCKKHIQGPALQPGKQIPQTKKVVETRVVEQTHTYKDKEGRKRTSTGVGPQIVKEIALCPKCAEEGD